MAVYAIPGRRVLFRVAIAVFICSLVMLDIAARYEPGHLSEAVLVSKLKSDGVSPDYATRIALVRSDDTALSQPAPLDRELTDEQVHEMVARVLDLSGDLKPLLSEGAKITLKPNVVESYPQGNGVNTDARVIEGIILWMESLGLPNLKYTVAEGGAGWLHPKMRGTPHDNGRTRIVDGFEVAGYRQMISRLESRGIHVKLVDADFGTYDDPLSHIRLVPVPDFIDFPEYDSYWIHDSFLDADVLISVPVMKIHSTYITVCLKNFIGIAAGAKYGTYKGGGGPNPGDPRLHRGVASMRNSVIREIVDLAAIARPQYNVVDAIVGKERNKGGGSPSVRRNMVLAGPDMVAVDTVCARLMGLNPDDITHVARAAREELGTMDEGRITVVGEHGIEESLYYFEHPRAGRRSQPNFGTSNHIWLLNSVSGTDINTPYLGDADESIIATPVENGWTEPIYFSSDFIDFEAHYGEEEDHTYYAFCWVDVTRDEEAELWINHDEDCALWIGGEKVYEMTRAYRRVSSLPSRSSEIIQLKKGRHPLLLKMVDRSGSAAFAFNICRIVPRPLPEGKATYWDTREQRNYERYAGTRVFGLKFDLNGRT